MEMYRTKKRFIAEVKALNVDWNAVLLEERRTPKWKEINDEMKSLVANLEKY